MGVKELYKNNRPLCNSILMGLFYFLFCLSINFWESFIVLFVALMLFLPGLTFPLTTCYFEVGNHTKHTLNRTIHLFLSVGIYYGGVWLLSAEGQMQYSSLIAGFLGSLLFLLTTRILLKTGMGVMRIIVASLCSGAAFLPYSLLGWDGLNIGVAVLFWTLINGFVINAEFRHEHKC